MNRPAISRERVAKDAVAKKFTNCDEANKYLKAPSRGLWNFAAFTPRSGVVS